MTTPQPLTQTDQQFLIADAQGSLSDLAHGQAGIQGTTTNELRQYAVQIVEDHSRLNMQLFLLAQKRGLLLPVTMTDNDSSEVKKLLGLSGKEFDRAFLEDEVRVNTQDVKDADKELSATTDAGVRDLVIQYRDTEQVMLSRAQTMLAAMK